MAQEEIIAVFKADIEQFKVQMAELGGKVGAVQTQIDGTTISAQNFSKQTKSASASVSTLSRGLGGVAGLLGVTGRLFGVNVDKIEALVFASREFVRVGQDLAKTQKLATAATQANTAATRAGQAATAAASGGISLLITGIIAAAGALYAWISAKKSDVDVTEQQIRLQDDLNEANKEGIKISNDAKIAALENQVAIIKAGGKETIAATENIAVAEYKVLLERLKQTQTAIDDANRDKFNAQLKFDENLRKNIRNPEQITKEEKAAAELLVIQKNNEINALLLLQAQYNAQIAALNISLVTDVKKITTAASDESKKKLQKDLDEKANQNSEAIKAELRLNAILLEEQIKFLEEKKKLEQKELDELHAMNVDNDELTAQVLRDDKEKELKAENELNDKRIDNAQQTADIIFKAFEEAHNKRQELLQEEITDQEKNIETQRRLAEQGLENTLAFEEKRAAELRRNQQQEAERAKRVKLLETFLNSLAEFSKDDPKNALSKALLQVALAQAAAAVFAEEGGIIGEIGARSNLSRKHKGGGDVLLHAQTGEGILSRREMDNLGKRNFHLLKDAARFPIRDDVFAMPKLAMAGGQQISNHEVVKEIKAMHHTLRNKKETHYDLKQNGEYMITQMENGVTEIFKGKLRKPRFK